MKRGRDYFYRYKKIILVLSNFFSLFPSTFRIRSLNAIRGLSGKFGIGVRYALLRTLCKSIGENVSVREGVYILNPQRLTLGDNVSIHPMSYIDASGEIEIGSDVSIAHSVTIMSTTHNYDGVIPIKDQGLSYRKVVISDNVWVGCKVTILSGVIVPHSSIIGANSLVNKQLSESNCVYAGVPAKKIKAI